jgi:glycosyltransferase involved in cell wall biosynthesis
MKSALISCYPEVVGRVYIVPQPAPNWLLRSNLKRTKSNRSSLGLKLFYPAAHYPHKNHHLLSAITHSNLWFMSELVLTIPKELNPNPEVNWIKCVGALDPSSVLDMYKNTDGLLFLSFTESLGFPLIEAMWVGLPIICPDLPYARTLCGNIAIYFNPADINSLSSAITELNQRKQNGWWPDWSTQLAAIPKDWDVVADMMLAVACQAKFRQYAGEIIND